MSQPIKIDFAWGTVFEERERKMWLKDIFGLNQNVPKKTIC